MAPSSAPPKARLLCRTGDHAGQTYDIESASTVGTSMDNQIVLQSPTISRLHARVFPKDGCFWLEDMGSKNGTRLDGTPVDEAMPLERLHVITFADGIDFVFVMAADAAQSETTLPHEPLAQAAEPSEPRSEEPAAGLTVLDMSPLEALPELDETPEEASEEPAADLTVMDMSPLGALPELDETTEEAPAEPTSNETVAEMSPFAQLPELGEDPDSDSGTVLGMFPFGALPELDETPEQPPPAQTPTEAPPAARPAEPASNETVADMSAFAQLPELGEDPDSADRTVLDISGFGALPELHEDPGQASPSFALTTNLGERGLVSFAISEGQTVLGRAPDCGISIPDEKFLSRRHAVIEVRGSEVLLRHLGSLNGTWIDGDQIDEATLRPGDSFKLGPDIEFTLVAS